jgi:tetratricopeptide (TPR) repeat protein
VYITSGKWLPRAQEIASQLSRLLRAAPGAGLDERQIAGGHYLLSTLSREHGDLDAAHAASLRALEAVRGADPASTARQLADTARCLALIERDMDRALQLLAEAEAIARDANLQGLVDLDWGYGLALMYIGDYTQARMRLMAALAGGRAVDNHWCESECLLQLATLELEVGRPAETVARCAELAPLVLKIGEGTEGPAAAVLEALARRAIGEVEAGAIDADARLELAIVKLREIDAKGYLAYALNFAAEQDLACAQLTNAKRRAEEALRAAAVVKRASQVVIARGLLARVALAQNDPVAALAHRRSWPASRAR